MALRYVIGLDLGPANAFSALAVVERSDDDKAPDADPTFAVRHLRRFPPGTPYKAVAAVFDALLADGKLAPASVVVDITAVGAGVLDLLRDRHPRPRLVPVFVTAGHHAEFGPHDTWLVPKKVLVTGLQLLLQGRRLAIPAALPEADLLARELGNFRAKVSVAANPLGAEWREGQDDDLVFAVALACWKAGKLPRPGSGWLVPSGAGTAVRWGLSGPFPRTDDRPPWWSPFRGG